MSDSILQAIENAKKATADRTIHCAERADYRSVKAWADLTTDISAILSRAADILAGER